MPAHDYTIEECSWISKIARELKQTDGGDKLWDANPDLALWAGNNRHVLEPGWTLKRPLPGAPGQQGAKVSQNNPYQLGPQRKKQLVLTFYEHLGGSHPSIDCELYVDHKLVYKGDSFTGKIVIPFADKHGVDLIAEETFKEAILVVQVKRRGVRHGPPQKIKLHIGGLTPLCTKPDGSVNVRGLQKILTNLGYAPGGVDGLYGAKTAAAVRAFQADHHLKVSGIPDQATCGQLLVHIETPMRRPSKFPTANDPVFPGANDPAIPPATGSPLALGETQFFQKNALWDPYEAWVDRTAPGPEAVEANGALKFPYKVLKGDQTGLRMYDTSKQYNHPEELAFDGIPKEGIRFFPHEVYVAPSDAGDESNKNPIWMLKYRSAFLDCGGWLKDQYDFAVLHGWHAYLCTFIPPEKRTGTAPVVQAPADGVRRMDHKFFQALGDAVQVEKSVSVVWASKAEFDWHNLTLIIPDLHLMTGLTANVWKPNSNDAAGQFYDLRAELNLFAFARQVAAAPELQHNVKVIQLGDTYDLWIGSPNILGHEAPLFTENKSSTVELEEPEDVELSDGQNYRTGRDLIAQHWAACIGPHFNTHGVDMRCQVLQWWVQAIQGVHNSPLEQSGVQGKPTNQPWVEWILKRRSGLYSERSQQLETIRQRYDAGSLSGNKVAERLAAEFPAQFDRVEHKPTTLGGFKINPIQPHPLAVHGWIESIEDQLIVFEEGCAEYVKYVGSDLNGMWLNPAEAAMRLLKAKYGIRFLYGNHDNYLILAEARGNACDARVRFIEEPGVFIEHAHRLEPGLAPPANANYDGNQTGYTLTNSVWRPRAEKANIPGAKAKFGEGVKDKLGEQADAAVTGISQLYYRREAGRFFVARSVLGGRLPHIFVIGHTHAPRLDLNYVHLNDGSDFRGPGNQSWGDDEGI